MTNSNKKPILVNKYLPNNFLAEKMVLSCLIINPETIEITAKKISIDMFYFKNHQELYKSILSLYRNNTPIDILTLLTFLQDNGKLRKIGGIRVLTELIRQIPNSIYLNDYLKLIKDKYIRRSLIKLGYELINSSYVTSIPLENMIDELENKLFYLTNEIQTEQFVSSGELITDIFFELKAKSFNPKVSGILSGFYELDSLTQGFQKSDLIIIAGRPAMGKTALSLSIATNLIKISKLPILFFSLEMSKKQIMYRLLSMETHISQIRLKNGELSKYDWSKLNKIIQILSKIPFFIDDTVNLTTKDLRSKIKTLLFEQREIGLVIIDYIQLMQNSTKKLDTKTQEISQITRSLKIIAREFNIPIIGLAQLSRNVEHRMDKKPILSDLRDSGSIEQDADLVILLSRSQKSYQSYSDSNSYRLIDLIIAKHRNGPVGEVSLKFNEQQTKFFNLE